MAIIRKNESVLTPEQMASQSGSINNVFNISVPVEQAKDAASAHQFAQNVGRMLEDKINDIIVKNQLPGGNLYRRA